MNLNGAASHNESAPPDLTKGWGIFYTPGAMYLGQVVTGASEESSFTFTLTPAFEYIAQTIVGPQGVNRPRYLVPLELMVDVDTIEIRPYAVTWLSTWGEEDRAEILKGLAGALKLRDQIRRSRSPIAIVPGGSLPPFKGRA